AAKRVERVHALALPLGQKRERAVEAAGVALDHGLAPGEVGRPFGERVPRRSPHRASSARPSSRRSSSTASFALRSTMGTPAPGCALLPQKYRLSHEDALLWGRQ